MSNNTDNNMTNQQPMAPSAPSYYADDEIDLKELFMALWRGKWIIIATTFIAAVIAVVYALSLPNIYKSEALLAPAEENQGGGLSGLAGQFGGLASLAGVNLGGGSADKTTIALELLKSRTFISKFVEENDLKPVIMGVKGWDQGTDTLIYDEDIYNSQTGEWVREVKAPKKLEPSMLEVHAKFLKESLRVTQNKETGLVKVAVSHFSPYVAKEFTEKLVAALNNTMRSNDIAEAERSISYLNDALTKTVIADMQQVFYQLIEQQQQTKMLANVREEYALKTIDPAVVAEKRTSPNRALVCFLSALTAFLVSSIFVILKNHFRSGVKRWN